MSHARRALTASHPLLSEGGWEGDVPKAQEGASKDAFLEGRSEESEDAALGVLESILGDDAKAWRVLRTLPHAEEDAREAVDTLAKIVYALVEQVQGPRAPSADHLPTSLQEAMRDEWDLGQGTSAQSSPKVDSLASEPIEQDSVAWLASLANQHTLDTSTTNTTQSAPIEDEAPVSDDESLASSESALPFAPVVELAHMVPASARPPPQLPRQDDLQVDRYGFVYEAETGTAMPDLDAYDANQADRKNVWDEYLAQHTAGADDHWQALFLYLRRLDQSTASGRHAWRQFQRLCHDGIPMLYRPAVWSNCVRAHELAEPGRYSELVESASHATLDRQICLDVRRTMPTNLFFGGQGPGVRKLQRLLEAHSMYKPTQGYCQGMNNLAAILLLTYTHEEDAFWAMAGLIETTLPPNFYASDMLVPRADQRVLLSYVRSGLPRVYAHVQALHVELAAVTYAWFLSLFTACLPTATLFRVWDMLLVDGSTALFRVAYAILARAAPALLAAASASAVYDVLRDTAAHATDAEALVQACVGLRASIRAADIASRRTRILTRTSPI